MAENGQDRLESWKEIAVAIGRDTRTAMRWAKERGMPVHRVPGGERGRVFASRLEIERWLRGASQTQSDHGQVAVDDEEPSPCAATQEPAIAGPTPSTRKILGRRFYVWVAALLVADIVLIAAFARWRSGRTDSASLPARVSFTPDAVHAFGADGHELWMHSFPRLLDPVWLPEDKGLDTFVRIGDLRGDGQTEVLIVAGWRLGPNPDDPLHSELECFSSAGQLLWVYSPNRKFQFGDHELVDQWSIYDLYLSPSKEPSIWVSVEHRIWGNSFVVQLDPATGRDTLRFVNTGTIAKLAELTTGGVTYLLASGFNNEGDGGSLAMIDERKSFAASPQSAGTRHKCVTCPAGAPDYYLVFPRSEINRITETYVNFVDQVRTEGDVIELTKFELTEANGTSTIYSLRFQNGIQPIGCGHPRMVGARFTSSLHAPTNDDYLELATTKIAE